MTKQPNILWICTEHQRFDTIGALNNPLINTPVLDKLVSEGVAFTNAFAQNTVCTPSRVSFLTGRYPAATRVRQNGQSIPEYEELVTKVLSDKGYDCGLVGKLHISAAASGKERRIVDGYRVFHWSHGIGRQPEKHGGEWAEWIKSMGKDIKSLYQEGIVFQSRRVVDRKYHQTTWCFDKALDFIKGKRSGSWLLSVNPFSAHDPFDYLPEFYSCYNPELIPLPRYQKGELENKPSNQTAAFERGNGYQKKGFLEISNREKREMKAAYYATIQHLDREIGRLLEWLERNGERENTLVIFHADHGEMLGDHGIFGKGSFLYDPAIRVPLILSWPGTLPSNLQLNSMTELVDIVPTIYELLGIEKPSGVQGKSLLDVIHGEIPETSHREGVYSEFYNSNSYENSEGWKTVYASMWRNKSYKIIVYHGEQEGELYDLKNDPFEFKNLWCDSGSERIKNDMLKMCFDKKVYTTDPLPLKTSSF